MTWNCTAALAALKTVFFCGWCRATLGLRCFAQRKCQYVFPTLDASILRAVFWTGAKFALVWEVVDVVDAALAIDCAIIALGGTARAMEFSSVRWLICHPTRSTLDGRGECHSLRASFVNNACRWCRVACGSQSSARFHARSAARHGRCWID